MGPKKFLILTAAVAGVARESFATTSWLGLGSDANFGTPTNWSGGVTPVAGDSLVFDGLNNLSPNNDLSAETNFSGITFNTSAGIFLIGGNAITLDGDITDNAASLLQTMVLPVSLSDTRTIFVTDRGSLAVAGPISG